MSKLSEELTAFSNEINKLAPATRDKVYAAIRASFGPVKSTRKTGTGEQVPTRDVDFGVIQDVLPPELRVDWRNVTRELFAAGAKHGPQWAAESYAYILNKFLLPQPTPGDALAATPGLVEALEKAGFVRNASTPTA